MRLLFALAALPLALNLGAVVLAGAVGVTSAVGLLVALTLANGAASAGRFVALRRAARLDRVLFRTDPPAVAAP